MNKLMLRRVPVLAVVVLCLLGPAACSNSKKDEAYKDSKALPPLEVPPDLINPPKDNSTAIPDLPAAAPSPAGAAVSRVNAAAQTEAAVPAVAQIERQGAQRWLVASAPAEQIGQWVKEFLLQKGFSLAKEDMVAGTLETEWRGGEARAGGELDAALQAGLKDKYKLRIEAGRTAGTSEVTVAHFGLQRVTVDGKPQWQPRATDPMLEAELLDQLRAYLQSEGPKAAPISDLPAVKAAVRTDDLGMATLQLNEAFGYAWRRVGIALGRGGFVIDDRNRSEGVYHIRLGTAFKEDAKAGFVARLFGRNASDPNEQYRVTVKDGGDACQVRVQFPGGGPVHTGIGERILNRIKEKME